MDMLHDIIYFTDEEFKCPCGCGITLVSQMLAARLDHARELYGKPIVINSGFRCITHNTHVGGKVSSSHRRGLAVDIKVDNSTDMFRLVWVLLAVGFKRIGVGDGFVHVDVDLRKAQDVMWTY
jgi:uncharacterized protein YcbK (DUF882 family)